jgi:thiol-disulfide isomerase/thioredoxin
MIKHTLLTAAFILATGLSVASADSAEAVEPKTVALLFYADWCGSCKALDPLVKEARSELDNEPVLFVTLDHTDPATSRQAAMMARALGLEEVYKEHAGRTGFLLLVDRDSKQALSPITRETTPEKIKRAIEQSLEGRSG